jgi:hypothetical protein
VTRGKRKDPADGIAAAVAPLLRAIAECVEGWRSQFDRPPTAHELVTAFEVVLAASADDLVEDAEATRATFSPPSAKGDPLDITFPSRITVKLASWYGLDQVELAFDAPRSGSLRCICEAAGDTVLVDFWHETAYPRPTEDDARAYLVRHAIPAWSAQRKLGPFSRARLRSFDGLGDPIDVELPQVTPNG